MGQRKRPGRVQNRTEVEIRTINFSFECAVLIGDADFALEHTDESFLKELIKQLQHYSTIEPQHLRNMAQHCHPIDWQDPRLTRPHGFSHLDEQKQSYPGWQLNVVGKARVQGFFRENVFYPVWFDRNHALYRT